MGADQEPRLNYIAMPALIVIVCLLCVLSLTSSADAPPGKVDATPVPSVPLALFHLCIASAAVALLKVVHADTNYLVVNYKVFGRSDIPEVEYKFRHLGRWTTFTVWCNTVGAFYFVLAVSVDLCLLVNGPAPPGITVLKSAVWEITFPMAFLVNLVVSFVLIPACKKSGKLDKLEILMRFRPQCLHNGFVLVAAAEAALAAPPMSPGNFPGIVLFGLAYVVFAWGLWLRTSIFHYFFMDPRFRYSTPALVGLLALLAGLHRVGCAALAAASTSPAVGGAVLLAALATCTFRDKALSDLSSSAQAANMAAGG